MLKSLNNAITCLSSEADGLHIFLRECLQSRFLTTVIKLKPKKSVWLITTNAHNSKNQSERDAKTRDLCQAREKGALTKSRLSGSLVTGQKEHYVCNDWLDFLTNCIALLKSSERWSVKQNTIDWHAYLMSFWRHRCLQIHIWPLKIGVYINEN